MSKLFRFCLGLVIWANITSPLSSQGTLPPGVTSATNNETGGSKAIPLGKTHIIRVGDMSAAKVFTPPTVNAKVGDTVKFLFFPKAHSVSQSTFENPCQIASGPEGKGFHSGLIPVDQNTKSDDLPQWTLQVLVPTPIWFHCAPHCGGGMVGAINPPTSGDQTFEKFVDNAKKTGGKAKNLKTGDPAGGRGGEAGTGATLQRGPPKSASDLAALGGDGNRESDDINAELILTQNI
ncbi:hypothetical protein PCASD_04126 [Puccinia coronata f. sp. avenae]|uniref:Blue (type 1) copper domain-containing protein n=1 Tax=Puccinia coronata f. sp. avenae TaxID=200324 RepID=A0A2N5S7X7_9BASI|nr:hypothetical protein PCASD_24808 [Puccinia coronata f. sp. avenae]PLW47648.1 hypothetical protein PCASD_04126 [Puccinia coronata f. sp. avenae]